MELFTVNRYKDTAKSEKPKENEDDILQKLLKKVEKRKRKQKHEQVENVNNPDELEAELVVEQAKKSKQSKQQKEESVVEDDIDLISAADTKAAPVAAATTAATAGDYEVLGEDVGFAKKPIVHMVLPPWLAHPTVISSSITEAVETDAASTAECAALPDYLAPHIRHSLKELQVTRLFPVQTAVIPWILTAHTKPPPFRPRDICVSAPTGSGKTLAFAIPVVQLLSTRVERKVRALVVLPVAELALQVYKVFKKLCERTDLTVCLLSKQLGFGLEQQKLVECYNGDYYSKVDIVVTTPGRLVDHLHATKGFSLQALQFLVIDEADRIMDAVFQNWLYHLDAHVKTTSDMLLSGRAAPLCLNELLQSAATQPHKLLFSATLSQDPEKLQNLRLFQPKLFTSVLTDLRQLQENFAADGATETARGEFIGKYTTPAELSEKYCITESRLKPLTLYSLISEHKWNKFLVFTNSAESSGRLCFVLSKLFADNLQVAELSASISAQQRADVLSRFARGKIQGLICSDALARGIDIADVDFVVSYDPPRHIKTYIHRIGRTARAGRLGTAVTLLTQKELQQFNLTLAEVGKVITQELTLATDCETEHATRYAQALSELREKLEKDKRSRQLLKDRLHNNALVHKDPAKMSLMEKLQLQVTKASDQHLQERAQMLSAKKKQSTTYKPKKKFNASAGKANTIRK